MGAPLVHELVLVAVVPVVAAGLDVAAAAGLDVAAVELALGDIVGSPAVALC